MKKCTKKELLKAFTLAEVLITLSIIGVVAALMIPGMVKHHNEKAWGTAQDLFVKKLEVALKSMNTDGRLSGYATTAEFVDELKKNIKINKVCTDDVTKCFAKEVVKGIGKSTFEITNTSIIYETKAGYDWAETVGVQFSNGVTGLIAYNKKCYVDPYDNTVSATAACIGITYDVTASKRPNTVGQDLAYNANVVPLGCAYALKDGTCFSKILAPVSEYQGFPVQINGETITCDDIKDEYGIRSCTYELSGDNKDYWLGAVYACGGVGKLPTSGMLLKLAQEVYNDSNILAGSNTYGLTNPDGSCDYNACSSGFKLDRDKAAPFLAHSPSYVDGFEVFTNWVWQEDGVCATRYFGSVYTYKEGHMREHASRLAVCVGE